MLFFQNGYLKAMLHRATKPTASVSKMSDRGHKSIRYYFSNISSTCSFHLQSTLHFCLGYVVIRFIRFILYSSSKNVTINSKVYAVDYELQKTIWLTHFQKNWRQPQLIYLTFSREVSKGILRSLMVTRFLYIISLIN